MSRGALVRDAIKSLAYTIGRDEFDQRLLGQVQERVGLDALGRVFTDERHAPVDERFRAFSACKQHTHGSDRFFK